MFPPSSSQNAIWICSSLGKLLGFKRWCRTLNAERATMARDKLSWSQVLLFVLLGLRTAVREEFAASHAELVYGESLRLPSGLVFDRGGGLGGNGLLHLLRKIKATSYLVTRIRWSKSLWNSKFAPTFWSWLMIVAGKSYYLSVGLIDCHYWLFCIWSSWSSFI